MSQIKRIEWTTEGLSDEVRALVRRKTDEIRQFCRTTVAQMVEIGECLIAVKDALNHGHFAEWLEAEFAWSVRTAQRMMDVARKFRSVAAMAQSSDAINLLADTDSEPDIVIEPENIEGPEERRIPARKPAKKAQREEPEEPMPDPELDEKTKEPLDDAGTEIKDAAILSIFNRRGELSQIAQALSDIRSSVRKLTDAGDELFTYLDHSFLTDIDNAYTAIKASMPYAVCTYCKGRGRKLKNCKACHKTGWITKTLYKMTPSTLKD